MTRVKKIHTIFLFLSPNLWRLKASSFKNTSNTTERRIKCFIQNPCQQGQRQCGLKDNITPVLLTFLCITTTGNHGYCEKCCNSVMGGMNTYEYDPLTV